MDNFVCPCHHTELAKKSPKALIQKMSEEKQKKLTGFNSGRRQFLTKDFSGILILGYVAKTGIAVTILESLLAIIGQKTFGSTKVLYPGYYRQKKELEKTAEWQVRIDLENLRLAAGEVCPEEIYRDARCEYKLIGSLKRYESEPTNKVFFETFKKVISRLHEAPRCYEILSEFNKENNNIRHEIHYHPYYVDLTYFMCSKSIHQIHASRTFIDTSERSLVGTIYHELIAHGSQGVEVTNNGKRAGMARARIMKRWEKELEGHIIKWYAEKEMYAFREISHLKNEMKKWIKVFPEWNYFRINEIEKLEVEDLVRDLLHHYQKKYKNDSWVNSTYLNKLVKDV